MSRHSTQPSLPTYLPPLRPGSVVADQRGRIWILPTTAITNGSPGIVYDVVERGKGIVSKIQLPEGYSLAGFGADDFVYVAKRTASGAWKLEQRRVQPN